MPRARIRKRPCGICRKWFLPDFRQIGRQQTCGSPGCRRELHRRRCRQWNRKNRDYFKANYLSAKLERTKDPPVSSQKSPAVVTAPSRIRLRLPKEVMVGVIGAKHLVILDYIIAQIIRRIAVKSSLAPP